MLHLSGSDDSIKIIQCSHALCVNLHVKSRAKRKNYNSVSKFLLRSSHLISPVLNPWIICHLRRKIYSKPGLCHYSKLLAFLDNIPSFSHPSRGKVEHINTGKTEILLGLSFISSAIHPPLPLSISLHQTAVCAIHTKRPLLPMIQHNKGIGKRLR